jgi:hypothetical protein
MTKGGGYLGPLLIRIENQGFDWQTVFSLGSVIIGLLGLFGGILTYNYQKKKEFMERSLIEVYAPLYMLLCKQEKVREMFLPTSIIKEAPIITMTRKVTEKNVDFKSGRVSKVSYKKREEKGLIDRKDFINAFNETNKGLASPELLRLISEYEVLVYLEEKLEKDSDEWRKATEEKVNVEYLLLKEIVRGYEEYSNKLGVSKGKDIKKFNL